jgi:UDP-N-acetylmuramate dehydrogenase
MNSVDRDALAARCREAGITVHIDHPLALLTTYGVGGSASVAVTLRSSDEVTLFAGIAAKFDDLPVAVIGRGSNTLVADSGFDGVAVVMATGDDARTVGVDGDVVTASGSMLMPVLARRSVQAGRGGLEWCVGVPGTVGGAVRMNAGGHGAEMVDSLVSVTLVSMRSGVHREVGAPELGLHFRGSALCPQHVVVSAKFRTTTIDPSAGAATIDDVVAWRRQNQPGGRNAGSVFVNPSPGEGSAGALIDSLGLRGHAVGGASVSDKHANFIQASEGATASDIIGVMSHVQDRVAEELGVVLRSEVRLVGFDDEVVARFGGSHHSGAANIEACRVLCGLMGDR